jgi:site-specific recombinase XerD
MLSNSLSQGNENHEHNVFEGISIRPNQDKIFTEFLSEQDISRHTAAALVFDTRKFTKWFTASNREAWDAGRVTSRDVSDFREHLRREKAQAVSTINRNLASLRKYFKWLTVKGYIQSNPAVGIKEIRRQQLAPQGLSRPDVRKLLREVELRNDKKAKALISLMLYTGARLSDAVSLEMSDIIISERSGTVLFRFGKGSKQRTVPLPLEARKALAAYLEVRPSVGSQRVFIGERGAMNARGIQAIFEKYKALTGIENLHCHVARHTFSHNFLSQGGNLSQLANLLGHESLNSTATYTKNSVEQLSEAVERLVY